MADAADKAISNKPIDPDVQALASLLLGKDVSKYNEVSLRFYKLQAIQDLKGNPVDEDDVIVYCGTEQWKVDDKKSQIVHKDYLMYFAYSEIWQSCITGTGNLIVDAFTAYHDKKAPVQNPKTGKTPTVITLCPVYLQKLGHSQFKTSAKLTLFEKLDRAASNIFDPISNLGRTQIDTVSLLDKCLLHELTHTRPAGLPDPTSLYKVITTEDIGDFGWNGCIKAANPLNADSLAYFGLGVSLLKKSPPEYISKDGKISTTRPKAKRSLGLMELMWVA